MKTGVISETEQSAFPSLVGNDELHPYSGDHQEWLCECGVNARRKWGNNISSKYTPQTANILFTPNFHFMMCKLFMKLLTNTPY